MFAPPRAETAHDELLRIVCPDTQIGTTLGNRLCSPRVCVRYEATLLDAFKTAPDASVLVRTDVTAVPALLDAHWLDEVIALTEHGQVAVLVIGSHVRVCQRAGSAALERALAWLAASRVPVLWSASRDGAARLMVRMAARLQAAEHIDFDAWAAEPGRTGTPGGMTWRDCLGCAPRPSSTCARPTARWRRSRTPPWLI